MDSLLIFGAGHGVAAHLLDEVKQAYRLTLVIRNGEQAKQLSERGFTVIKGDATDKMIVAEACRVAGKGATVVSTLGGENANYEAHRLIIDSAEQAGLRRMLLVTSIGCGDSWVTLSTVAKQAFGQAVREKTLAESWLQTSQLDYLILRPGGLQDGEATHQAKLYQEEIHGFVRRRDVALLMAQQLSQVHFERQIYAVVDPTLAFKRS
ncbi:NAD(P)H-binding protein [Orbaceae bacterium ESL0727]|nr:NAD(P)H-binding protein [Orbaceae bacterium ESL0727]